MKVKVHEDTRRVLFTDVKGFCPFAGEDDFLEVTQWTNGEGFDVEFGSKNLHSRCQLTWGQWKLLKKLVKKLAG